MTRGTRPTSGPEAAPLTYTLPAAGGAVWLGLGWASLAGLAGTAACAVLLLLAGVPLPVVAVLSAVGGSASALPIAGRPLVSWTPAFLGLQGARLRGADRWAHPLPGRPEGAGHRHPAAPLDLRLGFGPRRLRLTDLTASNDHPGRSRQQGPDDRSKEAIGTICHTRAPLARRGTDPRTFVLEIVSLGRFGILDPTDQDTELARWGTALATLCAESAVTSVQWLTHARLDTPHAHQPETSRLRVSPPSSLDDEQQRDLRTDLLADHGELIDRCARHATRHRHLLAVTVTLPQHALWPPSSPRTGRDSQDLLLRVVRDAATTLLAADLLARPLSPAEIGRTLRQLLDPSCEVDLSSARMPDPAYEPEPERGRRYDDPASWTPLSSRSSWDHCRTDDTVHRCFTVTGWPRLPMTADWLSPLLRTSPPAGSSRLLSVHARPVALEPATRRARAASTKARLDADDRARFGFTGGVGSGAGTVTDSLAEAEAVATEAELVAGYRMLDLSALLTVSAIDPQHLDAACQQLRSLAAAHRLDLRPLHGQHLPALSSSLPLGQHPGART